MKRVKLLTVIALLGASLQTWAQTEEVVSQWNFAGLTAFGVSPFTPNTFANHVTIGGLTRGPGVTTVNSGGAAASTWGGNGFDSPDAASAATAGDYVTFTVTATSGYNVSFTEIGTFNTRRSSTGPQEMQWQYSLNGTTFTDVGMTLGTSGQNSTGTPQDATTLSGETALQNVPPGTTVTFRLLVYNASQATGNWYFNGAASTNKSLIIRGIIAPGDPLSLKLQSFKGQQENNGNRLNWITAQEDNVDRFEVERSNDGKHFEKIAEVSATGNNREGSNQYTYLDNNVHGNAYYRLKMIDRDNKFNYSNIVVLRNDVAGKSSIRLYPNPTGNTLFLDGVQGKASYTITDATGRTVIANSTNATGTTVSVDVSGLAHGLYFLHYADERSSNAVKFVKQ